MDEIKLLAANNLNNEIKKCKENIKIAKYTQYDNVVIRPMYIDANGFDEKLTVPASLFRIIGKLVINEYQQKLIELEEEFKAL